MKQDSVQHHTGRTFADRATTYEAAEVPDTAIEAIRERVRRGNAPYEQHEEGPIHVILDAVAEPQASFDEVAGDSVGKVRKTDKEMHQSRRDELIESLQQDQMAFLRSELTARDGQLHPRESHSKDHAIAAPPERIPELPSEASRGLEMGAMGFLGTGHNTSDRPRAPRTSRVRRPWWREMFE